MNQDTPVYLGPEKLVNATKFELLFVEVHRIKRGYYNMKIVPLDIENINTNRGITLLHVDYLEKVIKKKPSSWLWSHKKWKHSRIK